MARKYRRDNRGRFAGGGGGATARGGRLKTAAGNKRKTQTMKAGGAKAAGAISKPKGLKLQSTKSLRIGIAVNRMRSINQKIGKGSDTAAVNISMSGSRGRRLNAEISRNVTAQKAATRSADKARNRQVKSDASRAKKLRDVQAGNIAKAKGISKGQVTSALKAQPPSVQIKALRNFVRENRANVRPARAAAKPRTGQEIMKAEVRKVQNKKLRDINTKIKAAGPSATNLRVEKLALQSQMTGTQPRQTAKQAAKSEKQTQVVRGRIAELRRQNARIGRAQANATRNADVRNSAASMSKASFARKPSKKTLKSQLRADSALAFYASPAKALRGVNKRKPGFRLPRGMR